METRRNPHKLVRPGEALSGAHANRVIQSVNEIGSDRIPDIGEVIERADDRRFLVRITEGVAPQAGFRRAYGGVSVHLEAGNLTSPLTANIWEANPTLYFAADEYPLYERSGNSHVPIDGTALVEATPSDYGDYLLFDWNERPRWAVLGAATGNNYAFTEQYPDASDSWANLPNGETGTALQNPMHEINGNTGVPAGTRVRFWRGFSSGAAYLDIQRVRLGDGGSFSEQQSVAIVGAVAGTFILSFEGEETAAIAFDANAAAVEAALEALSNITNVIVTGTGTALDPFVIEFADDTQPRDILQSDGALLKGDQEWLFDGSGSGDATFNDITINGDLTVNGDIFGFDLLQVLSLTDPGADRILFWDDSANAFVFLTVGSGLSIVGTTITATGGGGGVSGSGTTDTLPIWTGASSLGDSAISQSAGSTDVTITAGGTQIGRLNLARNPADGNLANGNEIANFTYIGNFNSTTGELIYVRGIYDGNGTTRTAYLSIHTYSAGSLTEQLRIGPAAVRLPQLTASLPLKLDSNKDITAATIATADIANDAVTPAKIDVHCGRMSRAAAQSIATSTWVKIAFDTEDFDVGGIIDVATNDRIDIARTGKYLVVATCTLDLDASIMPITLAVRKNGSATPVAQVTEYGSTSTQALLSDILDLTAGDYLELWVIHVEAGSENTKTGIEAPYFAIAEIP